MIQIETPVNEHSLRPNDVLQLKKLFGAQECETETWWGTELKFGNDIIPELWRKHFHFRCHKEGLPKLPPLLALYYQLNENNPLLKPDQLRSRGIQRIPTDQEDDKRIYGSGGVLIISDSKEQ